MPAAYVRACQPRTCACAPSFYGAAVGSGEAGGALRSAAELLAEPRAAEAMGRTVTFRAESAAAAAEQVRPYVDSVDEADAGALWPLVEPVVLRGPFAPLCLGPVAAPRLVIPSNFMSSRRMRAGVFSLDRETDGKDDIIIDASKTKPNRTEPNRTEPTRTDDTLRMLRRMVLKLSKS